MISIAKKAHGIHSYLEIDWLHFIETIMFWASIHVQCMSFRQAVLSLESNKTLPVSISRSALLLILNSSLSNSSSLCFIFIYFVGEYEELQTNGESCRLGLWIYCCNSHVPLLCEQRVMAVYEALRWDTQSIYARTKTKSLAWRAIISNMDLSLVNDHRLLLDNAQTHVEMGRSSMYRKQKVETIYIITFACNSSERCSDFKSSPSRSDRHTETTPPSTRFYRKYCNSVWLVSSLKSQWMECSPGQEICTICNNFSDDQS